MRLNNFISQTGLCSRRKADELIEQRRVKVNGEIAALGLRVNQEDLVEVDGKPLIVKEDNVYIALNKPVGITCTTERHIDGNIIDFINYPERIFPIGRLDKDSEGLIILTNDGNIVNEILRDENNFQKTYLVTVNKAITPYFIKDMSKGVKIYNPVRNEYTKTKPCKVEKISDRAFKIILSQGLNRQIRRMCTQFDYKVVKLQRVQIGTLTLQGLTVGKWRKVTKEELMGNKTQ